MKKLLLILLCMSSVASAKLDESQRLFFPHALQDVLLSQTQFPFFWWNFLIVESKQGTPDFETATAVCHDLQQQVGKELFAVVCGSDLSGHQLPLKDWANDVIYRKTQPTQKQLRQSINQTMAQIQLLMGQPQLLSILRADPLQNWEDYLNLTKENLKLSLQRQNGFLFDPATGRIAIILQMAQAPSLKTVAPFMKNLEKYPSVTVLGAHASNYLNEKQVRQDVEIVSLVGGLIMAALFLFLVIRKRAKALLLVPPVFLAVGAAGYLTSLIYGSIHGLTLAFGSAIIGLAIDYGMHGAFNAKSDHTWTSNVVGLLTTFAGLLVLMWSGIPLIQQLMVFSSFGLVFGFVGYYLLCKNLPAWFSIEAIQIRIPRWRHAYILVWALIACSFLAPWRLNVHLDIRKFDYQSPTQRSLANWLYGQFSSSWPVVLLHSKDISPDDLFNEAQWAKTQNIHVEGVGRYLLPQSEQLEKFNSWKSGCENIKRLLSANEEKLFAPFVASLCDSTKSEVLALKDLQQRSYLNSYFSEGRVVSVFLVNSEQSEQTVREKFPEAHSFREALFSFSTILGQDLMWMAPVTLLLAICILMFYYRKPALVLGSLIPFASGFGFVFLVATLLHYEVTLITVIGMVMVFGFSIDYGVFACDIFVFPESEDSEQAVWSTLTLAALTNILGFAPLLLAQHPVLQQLGFALFFGTIGTYIGSYFGVPDYLKFMKSRGWL